MTLDGNPLALDQAGADVRFDDNGNSYLLVDESRMYSVISLPDYDTHELGLSATSPNLSLFTFTFGAYREGP